MKILHVCTGWPLSYKGGITNYVRTLALTQHNAGDEVYVLGAPDEEKYAFHYIPYTSKIIPFTYSPLVDKNALSKIKIIVDSERFDIIHLHALEYIDWDLYTVIKNYHYVVSLHDYCFICPRIYMYTPNNEVCEKYDEYKCKKCVSYLDRFGIVQRCINKANRIWGLSLKVPHIKQNITTIRYKKFIELLNGADYILPVSYKVEEIYKNSGVTSKSKVLHIGNTSADEYKDEYKINNSDHKIKIVFLGRLTNYKGAEIFIKIANILKETKNIEFHFLGHAGQYSKSVADAKIINHGSYNPNDLPLLLEDYDMGMVLSIWHDNGPQVVMELLNNHVPVIGTKMGGIPDFIKPEVGFLFDPYSEEEIQKVISFIKSLTVEKINNMKQKIVRTTTTKEHYMELEEVYLSVLSGRT